MPFLTIQCATPLRPCAHPMQQREGMLAAANARIRALSFHVTQLQAEEKLVVRLLVGSVEARHLHQLLASMLRVACPLDCCHMQRYNTRDLVQTEKCAALERQLAEQNTALSTAATPDAGAAPQIIPAAGDHQPGQMAINKKDAPHFAHDSMRTPDGLMRSPPPHNIPQAAATPPLPLPSPETCNSDSFLWTLEGSPP